MPSAPVDPGAALGCPVPRRLVHNVLTPEGPGSALQGPDRVDPTDTPRKWNGLAGLQFIRSTGRLFRRDLRQKDAVVVSVGAANLLEADLLADLAKNFFLNSATVNCRWAAARSISTSSTHTKPGPPVQQLPQVVQVKSSPSANQGCFLGLDGVTTGSSMGSAMLTGNVDKIVDVNLGDR